MKILMIEDDKITVEALRLTLGFFDPESTLENARCGYDGLDALKKENFDVVLLDLGLPDIDGIKVLEQLHSFCEMPVLVVSARHDPAVITQALDLGAQDYILKPFNIQMLLARLKDFSAGSGQETFRKLKEKCDQMFFMVDNTQRVIFKGHDLDISTTEIKVLKCLIERCGSIVPLKTLASRLEEGGQASESAVHLAVSSLRAKLGDDPYAPKIIISEFDCGYRFISANCWNDN